MLPRLLAQALPRLLLLPMLAAGAPLASLAQDVDSDAVPPAAATAAPAQTAAPARPPLSSQQQAQVQYHIMAGELAAGRNQQKVAAAEFLEALAIYPDPDLARRATQLALGGEDLGLALQCARQWLSLDPTALEAREVIARIALRQGDLDEVYQQGVAAIDGHPGGVADGFRHFALLLAAEPGKGPEVEQVLTRLVALHPDAAGAHYALALVALRYEDLPQAEKSARQSLALEPGGRDATLLLVGVLVRDGKIDESDALMDKLLGKSKDKDATDLRMTYAKLLLEGGQREHARDQLALALKKDPKNVDARYALGVLAFNDSQFDAAKAYFEPLLGDAERGTDAEFQLGRIDEVGKRYPEALKHYDKVVSGGQALEAAVRRAAVLTKLGRVDDARASLDQIRKQFPPLGPRITLSEAEMLLDADRFDDALSVYAAGLAKEPDDADLLYGRSLVYERMGKFPEAEADLRRVLKNDENDARAMNALGYMLTVNTTRYDEAKKLISRALELAPDDAAVIDSKGWIEYKLGNAAEAKTWLQKALDKNQDPEISAHLGEVLWSLGEHDEARAVWDKALKKEPDHRVLLETVDRMTR